MNIILLIIIILTYNGAQILVIGGPFLIFSCLHFLFLIFYLMGYAIVTRKMFNVLIFNKLQNIQFFRK